jgi:hypothetical protein
VRVPDDALLAAAGDLRSAYQEVDWAATPVGPAASWSPALRSALDLALNTRFPVTLFWGPEFVLLYNEAYIPVLAEKHPDALGRRAVDVFPEAWATIGPWMQAVLDGEGAVWIEDAPVPLLRHGRLQESYFTFCYSPVRAVDGRVEGVIDIVAETTRNVIDQRRLAMLGRLREVLAGAEVAGDAFAAALGVLRENAGDLPAVDIIVGEPGFFGRDDLRLPLGEGRVLRISLSEHLAHDETYFGFLRLAASAIDQAVDRIRAREAEDAIAEALQRSLLTEPPVVPGMPIAVRYRPAAERARVGGDWYDAFLGPDGQLNVVVGDVTGHDQTSAAAMGQLRNVLRGVAWTLDGTPAAVLHALDRATEGLEVGTYATALLARVCDGSLQWSNAGHPPPVLIEADGAARLLEALPDPLLGLGETIARGDHVVGLEPGCTVVFYTDGLVERRSTPLTSRLAWLVGLLQGGAALGPEELCERILAAAGDDLDDDVALLVLRVDE